MALRLVYMGTPDFAVPALTALHEAGHEIAAVYTQPPRPAGRGMAEQSSPVQRKAEALGLAVRTPRTFKGNEEIAALKALGADAAVVVAYGLILPKAALEAPRYGCYNLHASKLPRWRGAAPIQRAIMAGDTETAVMVMRMEEGLDTGPVCAAHVEVIGPAMTAGELHDSLSEAGARLIVAAMADLEAGRLTPRPQSSDGVTYAAKIEKAEARIDFDRPAAGVRAQIHGLSPFPGAWLEAPTREGGWERVKVLRAEVAQGAGAPGTVIDDGGLIACREGAIRPVLVQRAGKRPMGLDELLRGFPLHRGTRVNPDK